jgi:hypothetical protein
MTLTEKGPGTENYTRAWLFLAAGALGLWLYSSQSGKISPRPAPAVPVSGDTVDWFLLLRMPAVTTQYESGIDTMRIRYGEWLDGLQRAGFSPMPLSEVYRRLKEGRGVPAKTVVLVFEPGFRRTYGIVAPILQQKGWPAVWITPEADMDKGHREYLTYHQTNRMIESGWWDVGYMGKRGHFVLKTRGQQSLHFGNESNPAWAKTSGGLALNRGAVFGSMHRLHVLSDWTTADLVNRLRVEVPVDKPVYLTLAPVQNLDWGVTTPADSTEEKHFDLTMPMWRRGTQISWFGAKTYNNFILTAEVQELIGHLAFRLRWDENKETGLIITASNRAWSVQQQTPAGTVLLQRFYRGGAGLKMTAHVEGNTLTLSEGDRILGTMLLPPEAALDGGLVQLYLYDALKGSASARGVQLFLTPLPS